jgi:FkbM family methyltransferase
MTTSWTALAAAFVTGQIITYLLLQMMGTSSSPTAELDQVSKPPTFTAHQHQVHSATDPKTVHCPPCPAHTALAPVSSSKDAPVFSNAILPILRDWGCGHENMEVPKLLVRSLGGRHLENVPIGRSRVVIDVGLGTDSSETLHALREGFVVFSFDPNQANIKHLQANLDPSKYHLVQITPGSPPDLSKLPKPPGGGYCYIFGAALGETVGAIADTFAGGNGNVGMVKTDGAGSLPIVTIDSCIPDWVTEVFFFKIDTQGYELRVLKGAQSIIKRGLARYILYEFSPFLMQTGKLGNHTELLHYLPSLGYMCFDMMGDHLALPRPSSPLSAYYDTLWAWQRSGSGVPHGPDSIGPWDDIMCANIQRIQH